MDGCQFADPEFCGINFGPDTPDLASQSFDIPDSYRFTLAGIYLVIAIVAARRITLHVARNPSTFILSGLFQVVILLTVAFAVALIVSEVRCLHVGVPIKTNI